MTKEEQQKDFEQALDNAWEDYVDRGAATVDALEENTQELAFAKGYNAGYKQALEHPTGGELLHVLNKGAAIGRREILAKACEWLKKNACNYEHSGGTCDSWFSASDLVESFRKYMEE